MDIKYDVMFRNGYYCIQFNVAWAAAQVMLSLISFFLTGTKLSQDLLDLFS